MFITKPEHITKTRRIPSLRAFFVIAACMTVSSGYSQIEVEVVTTGTAEQAATTGTATATPPGEGLIEDKAADDAAHKILPKPGTVLKSTENSELSENTAVAESPSLAINQDLVVLKDGETSEALAIKSGAELLRLLGVNRAKAPAKGEGEVDEAKASSLFDVNAVKRLKGDEPTVVYRIVVDQKPLPDPMIVPWIRQAKLVQERFDRAVEMLANNNVSQGREELLAIASEFPDNEYADQARELLRKLDDLSEKPAVPVAKVEETTTTTINIRLNPEVKIGTVIVDAETPSGNRVMIGGRSYKVGDKLAFINPAHTVTSITQDNVGIEVTQDGQKESFILPVRPDTGSNQ